jgi:hypothetical protein
MLGKETDRRAAPRYETRANPDNKDSDRRGPRGTDARDRGDNNYDRRAKAKNPNAPTKSYGPSRSDNDAEKLPSTYNYKVIFFKCHWLINKLGKKDKY